jgi:hypothetical protein
LYKCQGRFKTIQHTGIDTLKLIKRNHDVTDITYQMLEQQIPNVMGSNNIAIGENTSPDSMSPKDWLKVVVAVTMIGVFSYTFGVIGAHYNIRF